MNSNWLRSVTRCVPLLCGLAATFPAVAAPEDVLLEVDRAFSRMAASGGVQQAFAHYLAVEAVALNPSEQPVLGRAAIVAGFEGIPDGYELSWDPVAGGISASGDLGFTWGRYVATIPTSDGKSVERYGKYVTIWKKQADGSWKAVLDGGNPNPAPPGAEAPK